MSLNWFSAGLLLGIVQGLFLACSLIFSRRGGIGRSRKPLIWLLLLISLSLILRLAYTGEFYMHYPHLSQLADFALFVYGPLIWFYSASEVKQVHWSWRKVVPHLIPVGLYLVTFFVAFAPHSKRELIIHHIRGTFDPVYIGVLSTGIVLISSYLFKSWQLIKQNSHENTVALRAVLLTNLVAMVGWAVAFLFSFLEEQWVPVSNFIYQIAFLFLSATTFVIAFFELKAARTIAQKPKYASSRLEANDGMELKSRLESLLKKEQLYFEPALTLGQLAERLDTNKAYLSRVINESYDQNFYSYINGFRVEAFIEKVNSGDFSNLTYFGIATECGFSTKATFNKAFKRYTSKTPTEFFKETSRHLEANIS